jgi:hypothetical protein
MLLLDAHSFHALLNTLPRLPRATFEFAQGDAAVLVLSGHLLPFLHLGDAGTLDGIAWVRNRLVACHISNLNKGDRN